MVIVTRTGERRKAVRPAWAVALGACSGLAAYMAAWGVGTGDWLGLACTLALTAFLGATLAWEEGLI